MLHMPAVASQALNKGLLWVTAEPLTVDVPPTAAAEAETARKLNRAVVERETRARLLRAVKQTYGEPSGASYASGPVDLRGHPGICQDVCTALYGNPKLLLPADDPELACQPLWVGFLTQAGRWQLKPWCCCATCLCLPLTWRLHLGPQCSCLSGLAERQRGLQQQCLPACR